MIYKNVRIIYKNVFTFQISCVIMSLLKQPLRIIEMKTIMNSPKAIEIVIVEAVKKTY